MSRGGRPDQPEQSEQPHLPDQSPIRPSGRHRVDDAQRAAGLLESIDVQAQALAALDDVRAAEELALAEIAHTTWVDRVRAVASSNGVIEVELPDGRVITGSVEAVYVDGLFLIGRTETGRTDEWVIRADAVHSVIGVGMRTRQASRIEQRLTLASVMRDWAEEMSPVQCLLARGPREGTIVRVGRDHLDVAEHFDGEPSHMGRVRVLPITSLWAVRRWGHE